MRLVAANKIKIPQVWRYPALTWRNPRSDTQAAGTAAEQPAPPHSAWLGRVLRSLLLDPQQRTNRSVLASTPHTWDEPALI